MVRQFEYDRRTFRTFEIDTETALAAVVVDICRCLSLNSGRKPAAARVFPTRRHFQLHDLGAEISEHPA